MNRPTYLRLTTRRVPDDEPTSPDTNIVRALTLPALPDSTPRMPRIDLGDLRIVLGAGSLRFAIAFLDPSGRIAQSPLIRHLGWEPGERIGAVLGGDCVQLVRDPSGQLRVDPRLRLVLPATVLRHCRVAAGDQVFMIAVPDHDCLVVHSMANLAHMVRAHHADLAVRRRSGLR